MGRQLFIGEPHISLVSGEMYGMTLEFRVQRKRLPSEMRAQGI